MYLLNMHLYTQNHPHTNINPHEYSLVMNIHGSLVEYSWYHYDRSEYIHTCSPKLQLTRFKPADYHNQLELIMIISNGLNYVGVIMTCLFTKCGLLSMWAFCIKIKADSVWIVFSLLTLYLKKLKILTKILQISRGVHLVILDLKYCSKLIPNAEVQRLEHALISWY